MHDDIINGVTPLEWEATSRHPRLFFTSASLAALRSALSREPWAFMFARVRERATEGSLPDGALVYQLTGEPQFLESSCEKLTGLLAKSESGEDLSTGSLHAMALAYDWLFHDLSPEMRSAVQECLDRRGRERWLPLATHELYEADCYFWNISAHYTIDVVTPALAIYGDVPNVGAWLRYVIERGRVVTAALSPDGVSPEGICYGGFFNEYYVQAIALVKDLLGVDFFRENDYLKNVPAFYLYSMLPKEHVWRGSVHLHFGDSTRGNWHGPEHFLNRLAGEYADGHARWTAQVQAETGATAPGNSFLNLAWYDESVPAEPPDDLPLIRHFGNQDLVLMRSGWDADAAVFGFKCGPHAGHYALQNYTQCIGGGHMACDAGSFQLFAHGDWLISDGWYATKHTEYRNTVVVNGIGQTGDTDNASDWFECTELRREKRGPSILRVDAGDAYDYVIGNVMPAYEHSAGLSRYLRHVLYVRPSCWVIVDELRTREPSTFDLFFHAFEEYFQTDRPFHPAGDRAWTTGGRNGSAKITSLLPDCVEGYAEEQAIKGISVHRDREMSILRLRNGEPARAALFVTVLEAYPTSGAPAITPTIEGVEARGDKADGGGAQHRPLALALDHGNGRTDRFVFEPGQADLAVPVLRRETCG